MEFSKKSFKKISLYAMAFLYIGAGVNHFVSTDFYLPMMPDYLPWPKGLVYLSGLIEVGFGFGLCIEKTRKWSAWGIILLLIAVFPAHIFMYQNPENFPELTETILFWRMPFQLVFMGWAYSQTH